MSTDFSPAPERTRRARRKRVPVATPTPSAPAHIEQFCMPALRVPGAQLVFFEHLSGEHLPERLLALVLTWVSIRDRAARLAASVRAATGAAPDESVWQALAQRQRDSLFALIAREPDRTALLAHAHAQFFAQHPVPVVERLVHFAATSQLDVSAP
jgi:hypothetical protein